MLVSMDCGEHAFGVLLLPLSKILVSISVYVYTIFLVRAFRRCSVSLHDQTPLHKTPYTKAFDCTRISNDEVLFCCTDKRLFLELKCEAKYVTINSLCYINKVLIICSC